MIAHYHTSQADTQIAYCSNVKVIYAALHCINVEDVVNVQLLGVYADLSSSQCEGYLLQSAGHLST